MAKSRIFLFEQEKIPAAVLSLSLPTIVSNLVTVVYSLADTFFVGLLNNPVQTAAVSLAAPVLLAFNAVNNLFGVGASSMMSRALGAHDFKTMHQSSAFGFYGALAAGLLFSLLAFVFINPLFAMLGASGETVLPTGRYLLWTVLIGAAPSILNVVMAYLVRAEGATTHAALGTMSGCLLNIILDPFFILPGFLNMGAEGAALATLLSNCFAVGYFLVYIYAKRGQTHVSIRLKDFTLHKKIVSGVCSVGIPASIQNLLNVASQMLMNNLAAGYGTTAVAAMGIATKAAMVPMYISQGISQGVMPLVGYAYGAKNAPRFKEAVLFTIKFALIVLFSAMALFELFPGTIVSFFINNEPTVEAGSRLIRGLALAIPFLATDFLAVGVFQAVGQGSKALFMAIMRKVVLEIPAMLLLNWLVGLYGLGYSQFCAEFVMAFLGLFLLMRFYKKWRASLGVCTK